MKMPTLHGLPMPFKLLFTAALFTLGTGYLFALTNVAIKVGFSGDQVALKYYGNEASRAALREMMDDEVAAADAGVSEEMAFSFDDLDEAGEEEPLVSVPTLEALVAEAHFHLFGYVTIFFLCGLIMAMSQVAPLIKNTLILAPFIASVLDIWSILLTRFVGPGFAWLLIISGMVMAMSFLAVFVISIYQLWFLNNHAQEA